MSEPHLSTKPWRARAPRSFHVNKDESLICRHRETSVCGDCAKANREILEVYGNHYWMASEAEYAELASKMMEKEPEPKWSDADSQALAERTAQAWREDEAHRAAGLPTTMTSLDEVKHEARVDKVLDVLRAHPIFDGADDDDVVALAVKIVDSLTFEAK